ncbi:MAG TPA: DUF6483 family protein [Ardenticatenaceae bacterium]|jgi:tetratricopeptide (TPR) repeat protein
MIKRDYILRMIDELARVITYAIGLTHTKDYEGGLKSLNQFFSDTFGWESDFVNAMPETYLLGMLKTGERLDVDATLVLAALLKAEADIYTAQGEPAKAYHRYVKALNFFLAARESGVPRALPDEWEQTEEVLEKLADYDLPPATMRRLWTYYRATKQHASAEDVLWNLLAATEFEQELVDEGIAFYEGLLAAGDEALDTGSLSRAEVEEALSELRATQAE